VASLTPLYMSQRCQWYHCACNSGVIDDDSDFRMKTVFRTICENISFAKIFDKVVCPAVSLTLLWHAQQSHWHRCAMYSGVSDTAVACTVCHWHHCVTNFVDFLLEFEAKKAVNQGPRGSLMKKTRGKKSRVRVPLKGKFPHAFPDRYELVPWLCITIFNIFATRFP
jgi:hypothetical protein